MCPYSRYCCNFFLQHKRMTQFCQIRKLGDWPKQATSCDVTFSVMLTRLNHFSSLGKLLSSSVSLYSTSVQARWLLSFFHSREN